MHFIILIHQLWVFEDSVYETLDCFQENKGNDAPGYLLLASLDKLTQDRDEFHDRTNQLLAFQNTERNYKEVSYKIDWIQV